MRGLNPVVNFLIILVLGSLVLREGSFILVPVVWGIFFAFALHPISNWFEKRHFPRSLSIILAIGLVSIVGFGIIYILVNQMVGLIQEIPEIQSNLETKFDRYYEELTLIFGENFLGTRKDSNLLAIFQTGSINQTLFSTGKSLTLIGIIPLYIFLLIYYKDFFAEFLVRFSKRNNEEVLHWVSDSGKVIQAYLVGMVRVTGIVAFLAGIFFYLMGIKYFLLFAAFVAFMNLIPYVGVFISSVLVILYVFLTTDSLFYPVITFAVLWGIQLFENNVITPYVVGSKVKVNALAVIFAILIGGWLWGISGMMLFIPLVGVLKITLERSQNLKAFAYLLGDEVPVSEESENFWKVIKRRLGTSRSKKS